MFFLGKARRCCCNLCTSSRCCHYTNVKPTAAKNFDDYASQIFIPFLATKLRDKTRLDLVWDTYKDDSLKTTVRSKRGKGVHRRVAAAAAIPRNWHRFLRADESKMEIFAFLTQIALNWLDEKDKQLVMTDGAGVHSKPLLEDPTLLDPCNHEEADSRMVLHTSHATKHDS